MGEINVAVLLWVLLAACLAWPLCLWIGYRMGRRESCRLWASLGGFWLRGREGIERYEVTKSGRYSRPQNQPAAARSIWKS